MPSHLATHPVPQPGHPHEYVAAAARAGGVGYVKEGNCFTRIADPASLAQIADTMSQPATIGRPSSTGGSTPPASASGWTWPSSNAAGSATARSSSTWASAPPDRQHLVDRRFVSACAERS